MDVKDSGPHPQLGKKKINKVEIDLDQWWLCPSILVFTFLALYLSSDCFLKTLSFANCEKTMIFGDNFWCKSHCWKCNPQSILTGPAHMFLLL